VGFFFDSVDAVVESKNIPRVCRWRWLHIGRCTVEIRRLWKLSTWREIHSTPPGSVNAVCQNFDNLLVTKLYQLCISLLDNEFLNFSVI